MRARKLAFLALMVPAACGGAPGGSAVTPDSLSHQKIQAVELSDEQLAPEVKRLLTESTATPDRLNRLTGVTQALLRRAKRHFESGQEETAMQATMGALLLTRSREFRPDMFQGTEAVLLQAAAAAARVGDEGRALAFYQLAAAQGSAGTRAAEIEGHLGAIQHWQQSTRTDGSMQAVGSERQVRVMRALIECSEPNLREAREATIEWLHRAFAEGRREAAPTTHFEHDERMEARRAVIQGAVSLVALHVRDQDAQGALAALDVEPIASVASSKLVARLEAAAKGQADAWADLFGLFESAKASDGDALDVELAQAAAFGAAVELYRSEPKQLRAALPIATLLVSHGMGDVTPLLLSDAAGQNPEPRDLGWVLRLIFTAMGHAEELNDLAMARRVFTNGRASIELGTQRRFLNSGTLRPGAGDFYFLMGAMESRAGHLDRAQPHLTEAVQLNPTREAFRLLVGIERQQGRLQKALESAQQIVMLTKGEGDNLGEARALLLVSDLQRAAGDSQAANVALAAALKATLSARQLAKSGGDLAAAEIVLAEGLERYDQLPAANQAALRAYDAARYNLRQLTVALIDSARRALTYGDLSAGRMTLRRAIDARLRSEDLVYVALWVKLLHQRLGVPSDGSVEEALAQIDATPDWTGSLREWGRGALNDEQLVRRAEDTIQNVEARFYVAMSAPTASQTASAELRDIAGSTAIELIEVRIAQDVVARAEGAPVPSLPAGIELP